MGRCASQESQLRPTAALRGRQARRPAACDLPRRLRVGVKEPAYGYQDPTRLYFFRPTKVSGTHPDHPPASAWK